MDKHEALRNLPPLSVLKALGIDISTFKKRTNKPEWAGKCPIHGSKNNAGCFSVHEDGRWNCFSCGAKGKGSIDLVMQIRQHGFQQACDFLTVISPVEPPSGNGGTNTHPDTKTPPTVKSDASSTSSAVNSSSHNSSQLGGSELKPLEKDTWSHYKVDCPWLEARIPDKAVRERYQVFCYDNPSRRSAYSGRVMVPVRDVGGLLYGYLGRKITDTAVDVPHHTPSNSGEPKYLFPKNLPKSHFLFGAHELTRQDTPHNGHLPLKVIYLVESPFCVMHFASLNLPAVSAYGWAVSDEQLEILTALARGVVVLPDRNKYQESKAHISHLATRLWIRFPPLPDGLSDPELLPDRESVLALTR